MLPSYIVVHHSLTVDGRALSWDDFRRYHVEHNHWRDIGYHAGLELVEDHLEMLIGRPWDRQGAHCHGYNDKSVGVCIVGNFDLGSPPAALWREAVAQVAWMADHLQVPTAHVIGHREGDTSRTCPGAHFDMAEFRAAVATARAARQGGL